MVKERTGCLLNPNCRAIIKGEVKAEALRNGIMLGIIFTFMIIGIFRVIRGVFFGW